MSKQNSYLFFVVIFFLVTGCTMEQKLAKTYADQGNIGQFYLMQPSFVFKYNLKEFEIPGIDTLDEFRKDSLLMENSLFLKFVSDSVFIDEFTEGFKNALENYGAEVMVESEVDTLMQNGGTPYIINLAQFSLEEYIHPYRSEELVYDEVFVIDGIDLNAINYNVWLELGRMNTEEKNKVLFASDYLHDEISGSLKQNLISGKVIFDYSIDTITMPQVYESARQFGNTTAGYLFDYLMNTYIDENLSENYPYERVYYHYDPQRKILYSVEDEYRLHELDSY
jgi:hypothetical protein